jgi:hypothetical protein
MDCFFHIPKKEIGPLRKFLVDLDGIIFFSKVNECFTELPGLNVGIFDGHPEFSVGKSADLNKISIESVSQCITRAYYCRKPKCQSVKQPSFLGFGHLRLLNPLAIVRALNLIMTGFAQQWGVRIA